MAKKSGLRKLLEKAGIISSMKKIDDEEINSVLLDGMKTILEEHDNDPDEAATYLKNAKKGSAKKLGLED